MKYGNRLSLALVLAAAAPAVSATKNQELPDKEMLQMMELLREMDLIKRIDMLRDLHRLEAAGDRAKNLAPQQPAPAIKKETPK
jgi:hypothetical protein